uniref:Multidrug and toxic compound extrusion protein n=1 Tax=Chromera velia CCMP2878 TaxID=1169474 RepID=A0A0G4GH14_9ALVE|eukprot:Cvel_21866.t1-p1 / transcript=Cvel_21866.t1 / gene=Cvel_21866 / organism=Chromera_velia_CCMP2878 / gene_product=Multidrug and toxin extrusion protein 2, putative / transcript_product=Multidrug and toxin extrusion protein 2, putative / location=Cvel_scaffold2090:12816-14849(-) / protein_length=540 / sequence_SO=supercontig / SO=protein_coding / is_pseudo=false
MSKRAASSDLVHRLLEEGGEVNETVEIASTSPARRNCMSDFWDLLVLSGPIFIVRVSWVIIKTTDTALIGNAAGTEFLAASAASDLWTSSTGVFITASVLGTFCSQAIGAGNKKAAGAWLMTSDVLLSLVQIPVIVAWCCTGEVLKLFGMTEPLVGRAQYFAWVLALSIPVRVYFSNLTQYFQAQSIMYPGTHCSIFAMVLNLALGLVLVCGIGVPDWDGYGFWACPWVTTVVEFLQLVVLWLVYCQIKKLHVECWPEGGWKNWRTHVTGWRLWEYTKLYVPAAFSIASDFWRMSVIGMIAASFGDEQLAVFNSSYRILWISLTFVGSLSGAVSIKLGVALGGGDTRLARRYAAVGGAAAVVVLCVCGVLVIVFARQLGRIFGDDPEMLASYEEIRYPLCAMLVLMNFSVYLEQIPMAMGRTGTIFWAGFLGSWAGQVPGVLFCTQSWRKDLVGLYTGAAAGYGLLCVILLGIIGCTNWKKVAEEAFERAHGGAGESKKADGLVGEEGEEYVSMSPTGDVMPSASSVVMIDEEQARARKV